MRTGLQSHRRTTLALLSLTVWVVSCGSDRSKTTTVPESSAADSNVPTIADLDGRWVGFAGSFHASVTFVDGAGRISLTRPAIGGCGADVTAATVDPTTNEVSFEVGDSSCDAAITGGELRGWQRDGVTHYDILTVWFDDDTGAVQGRVRPRLLRMGADVYLAGATRDPIVLDEPVEVQLSLFVGCDEVGEDEFRWDVWAAEGMEIGEDVRVRFVDAVDRRAMVIAETCEETLQNRVGAPPGSIPCFVDDDGDGYAASIEGAVNQTGATCPAGYTAQAPYLTVFRDCADRVAAANPGQPEPSLMAYCADGSADCANSSFDYNCDGEERPSNDRVHSSCYGTLQTCGSRSGWEDGLPECGSSATYVTCRAYTNSCVPESEEREVTCW